MGADLDAGALTQSLASYGLNTGNLAAAARRCERHAEIALRLKNEKFVANAYHQLGMIAQDRSDWDAAERWYWKLPEIKERLGPFPESTDSA